MATPITAAQVIPALQRWGIPYQEVLNWTTNNRNAVGLWGPVHGFMWHHSGVDVTDGLQYVKDVLYPGDVNLPGPWCHFSIGPNGTVYLVGWGRVNHAGGGDQIVLNHVINEDYSGLLVPTKGNGDGIDGNARFYGVEIQYSGSHAMSAIQYTTALKLTAAILEVHAWTSKSVIGHGEWSNTKWDPGISVNQIMDMPKVRADVAATLASGPVAVAGERVFYYKTSTGSLVERKVSGVVSVTHPSDVTVLDATAYATALNTVQLARTNQLDTAAASSRALKLSAYTTLKNNGMTDAAAQMLTGYTP